MAPVGLGVSFHFVSCARGGDLDGPSGLAVEVCHHSSTQDYGVPRSHHPDPWPCLHQQLALLHVCLLGKRELGVGAWEDRTPGFPQAGG